MYFVTLPNRREEGPLTEAQVAERIHARQLAPDSRIKGPRSLEWQPISEFPEFKGPLRQYADVSAILNAPRRSRLAVAALILGITGVLALLITGLAAESLQRQIMAQVRQNQTLAQEQRRSLASRPNPKPGTRQDVVIRPGDASTEPDSKPQAGVGPRRRPGMDGAGVSDMSSATNNRPGVNRSPAPPAVKPPMGLQWTLGIAGGVSLLSMLGAMVCGGVALVRIRRPANRLTGQNLAFAGLGCAGLMLGLLGVGISVISSKIPMKEARRYAAYDSRMKALTQLHAIAITGGGTYPAAEKWCDTLKPLLGEKSDAIGDSKLGCKFGYNARVEGRRLKEVPKDTVVFFELRKPAWNMAGGQALIKRPGDLAERVVVVCADGRARLIPSLEVDSLRWEP
jgi:hypothetical protein